MSQISAPSQGRHASCRVRTRPDSETATATCGGRSVGFDGSCSLSIAGKLSGSRLERGLPYAQLLSVVDLVLAGRDQAGLPRPGQHPVGIRYARALAELRDAPPLGGVAQKLR